MKYENRNCGVSFFHHFYVMNDAKYVVEIA